MFKEDEWVSYDSYREIKSTKQGKILVIRPVERNTIVPLFCDICGFPMKTLEDSIAFRKSGCCERCDLHWSKKEIDKESEEWKEYMEVRVLSSKPNIQFK